MATQSTQSRKNQSNQPARTPDPATRLGSGGNPGDTVGREQQDRALVTRPKSAEDAGEREGSLASQPVAYQVPSTPEIRQYGALALPQGVRELLAEPVNPAEVEIRPDGLIYAPWTAYAERLDEAFGAGNWAQVPQGPPHSDGTFVSWQFTLYVLGNFVSTAVGEHPDPGNRRMSLANRAEAAKSDALVKNCKALGIYRDLWRKSWIAEWQDTYAVKVWALQNEYSTKGAWLWRRKDGKPFYREKPMKETDLEQGENRRDYADDARDHISSIQGEN